MPKGRIIDDKNFNLDDFNNLFEYLKNNEDYVLDFRNNSIVLYNSGRNALEISVQNSKYLLQFNFNNADILLKNASDSLSNIIETLNNLCFNVDDYQKWYDERKKYLKLDRLEKSKEKKPNMNIKAYIDLNGIKNYNFNKLLDTISPIFKSYGNSKREEEKHKTKLAQKMNSFKNNLIVFDTEYTVSYEDANIKEQVLNNQKGKMIKPDLVALKKVEDKYEIVFIELKTNLNSATGTSNIIDHLEDNERYKTYFEENRSEKEQLKNSVNYILQNKIKYGLLKDINYEDIKDKIDFNKSPELIIMCVLNLKEYINLSNTLKEKFKITKRNTDWNNAIIVLDKDCDYDLLEKNEIKKFIN